MERSLLAQQQLQAAIKKDIADRTAVHQERVRRLSAARAFVVGRTGTAPPQPLNMLANGDSWFDYPLTGNSLPIQNTDVIAQLKRMGTINPLILSVAHHGDATTDELALPKQQRMIEALTNRANWGDSGKPDAILFSGGGNDIVGDQFCILLDYVTGGSSGLDQKRFKAFLDKVAASYADLLVFRDRYAAGVPIYTHCYDFPIPNGVHPACIGPWLQPSLDFMGWHKLADGQRIVKAALTDFKLMLQNIAANTQGFVVIDTQGTLQPAEWANELHATPEGFAKIAALFVQALHGHFPASI